MTDRWAVISDVHGNVDALKAVLAEIDRLGCSRILNLGDHASGPLAAAETLNVLMARDDMISIRGNHDRYLLTPPETLGPSDAVAAAQLTNAHKEWLAALPATALVEGVFLCHGTPDSDETYWLHDVTPQGDLVDRGGSGIVDLAGAAPVSAQVLCVGTPICRALCSWRRVQWYSTPAALGCPPMTTSHRCRMWCKVAIQRRGLR